MAEIRSLNHPGSVSVSMVPFVIVSMGAFVVVTMVFGMVVFVMLVRCHMLGDGLFWVGMVIRFGEKTDHLKHQQSKTSQDQHPVGRGAEFAERTCLLPHLEEHQHDAQCADLPQFHTQIKGKDPNNEAVISKGKFLQTGRKAKTMDESKAEDHPKQVGCVFLEDPLKSIEVLEPLVNDTDSDDRVDEVGVCADARQCCAQECDAVSHGEGGDEPHDISKTRQKEDHADQEQQVIVAGQHVGRA